MSSVRRRRSRMQAIFVALLLLASTQVNCGGQLEVRFLSYDNPDGTGSNGHCCDGRWVVCQSTGCDYLFKICLDNNVRTLNTDACYYGQIVTTSSMDNMDNVVFGEVFGGVRNPMIFPFYQALNNDIIIKVDVWDQDNLNNNDHVDFLTGYATDDVTAGSTHLINLHGRTSLRAQLRVVCDSDWYGARCGRHCIQPSVGDHYHCDNVTGHKVCVDGWSGPDCTDLVTTTAQPVTTTVQSVVYVDRDNADCHNLAQTNQPTGLYMLQVGDSDPFMAYCDMSGPSVQGWTVLQRRVDGSVDFYRHWYDYKQGFGTAGSNTEFWLGLDNIYRLTNQRRYKLRIKLQLTQQEHRLAEYDHFRIDSEAQGYTLHISGYHGDAGDALNYRQFAEQRLHNGMQFSAYDRDHDRWTNGNCAQTYRSGWWFNDCYWANLNGRYVGQTTGSSVCPDGVCAAWRSVEGFEGNSLLAVEMAILPH